MNTNKLFLAGALAIASLSLASCSQDEPATSVAQVAQVVNKTADRSDLDPSTFGKYFIEGDTTQHFMYTLVYEAPVVTNFDKCSIVVTTGNKLSETKHGKDIIKKGGLFIITDAKFSDVYKWMDSQDWSDMPNVVYKCPEDFKDCNDSLGYFIFNGEGFDGTFAYKTDALRYWINSYFEHLAK